jgi:hypothetical protein
MMYSRCSRTWRKNERIYNVVDLMLQVPCRVRMCMYTYIRYVSHVGIMVDGVVENRGYNREEEGGARERERAGGGNE